MSPYKVTPSNRFRPDLRSQESRANQDNKINNDFYYCQD